MGEEAADDYELELLGGGGEEEEDERVVEWETGLPGADELTPLSQSLVPPGLAAAFRIPPEPGRTLLDVHRASAATVSRLRRASSSLSKSASAFPTWQNQQQVEAEDSSGNKQQQEEQEAGKDSTSSHNNNNNSSSKRPRLVWTPQLHKRFVDVVAHLGIKNAVPKTIMQLMNVEGLTRENVASHLQKYRLYVKRMQGLSNEGPSPSDHIFASTPVPHTLVHEVPAPAPPPHMAMAGAGGGYAYGGYSNGHSSFPYYHHHATK